MSPLKNFTSAWETRDCKSQARHLEAKTMMSAAQKELCGQNIFSTLPEITHMSSNPIARYMLHWSCAAAESWTNKLLLLCWDGEHSGVALTFLVKFSDSNASHMGLSIRLHQQAGDLEPSVSPLWKQSIFCTSFQSGQGVERKLGVSQPLPCYYNRQLKGHQNQAPLLVKQALSCSSFILVHCWHAGRLPLLSSPHTAQKHK